jgi:two-component system chemotaxis response regulator CheY
MNFTYCVVDDATFFREIIKHNMKALGGDFLAEGVDGKEAIEIVQQHHPDLLVLDLIMPVMNGFDALRTIKALHPEQKVLVCSTLDAQEHVEMAIQLNCDFYLTKPFKKPDLKLALDSIFSSAEVRKTI